MTWVKRQQQGSCMWIKNCWYVIAWEHEIPSAESTELFQRKVLNEPVVVYRKQDGKLAALENRCCHRHAPLSAGRREGDSIRCGYHGLKFNAQGHCTEIPGADKVPSKACVRAYPVVTKNNRPKQMKPFCQTIFRAVTRLGKTSLVTCTTTPLTFLSVTTCWIFLT
jgi:nitrite reductase/ring-hydroxylating ferredoxin subunit